MFLHQPWHSKQNIIIKIPIEKTLMSAKFSHYHKRSGYKESPPPPPPKKAGGGIAKQQHNVYWSNTGWYKTMCAIITFQNKRLQCRRLIKLQQERKPKLTPLPL